MSRALIFTLASLIVFSIIASSENFAEAKSATSPLDQYLQYRTQYGKDTAREDIMDNQVIDSSINSVEFTYAESISPPKHEDNSANTILIQRTILRDPQGIQHNFYHYHKNFHSLFFDGNPSDLARYDINLILPEGSAPGKWALIQMKLDDKANNSKSYDFTELIHFNII